jgi:hypothetical protein
VAPASRPARGVQNAKRSGKCNASDRRDLSTERMRCLSRKANVCTSPKVPSPRAQPIICGAPTWSLRV